MTRPLTDRDYQALAGFRHALRLFLRFSEQAARTAGITPAQHQLLLAVRGHAGATAPSSSDLAEALQLRLHSVVELIGRAEANDLVIRHADPDDHRRTLVALTPIGEVHLAHLSLQHRDELLRFRREMSALLDVLDD